MPHKIFRSPYEKLFPPDPVEGTIVQIEKIWYIFLDGKWTNFNYKEKPKFEVIVGGFLVCATDNPVIADSVYRALRNRTREAIKMIEYTPRVMAFKPAEPNTEEAEVIML